MKMKKLRRVKGMKRLDDDLCEIILEVTDDDLYNDVSNIADTIGDKPAGLGMVIKILYDNVYMGKTK